ncbi:MAG: tRNA (uridine(34)/cytosine(34)/5-carboxymethylaminomethyluridine(34)-2'-O)-methyltransferase TrmL [Bacillota bacterium]|nr:tRNA (uridine(34)/cytosine(34)/5-carboxymethylaminomethyluridine(34)-2'-O)-methyltransferase TrmL [Bacillota bacterium]
MLNIVLVEPEIPQNTGNIARTCAATNTRLHLVKPLGFTLDDRKMKRCGLDYWHLLKVQVYENLDDFFNINKNARFVFSTTKAKYIYSEFSFRDEDFILFGKETAGLPEKLLKNNIESCIRIPMVQGARSLNLSNSVAVVTYEALRQLSFPGLTESSDYFKNA